MRPGTVRLLPVLAFVSGAAALTYESLWLRSFGLVFGITTHAVSVTLVTFMGGLALGSYLISRRGFRAALRAYAAVEGGIALSALVTYPVLRRLPAWYGGLIQARPLPGSLETVVRFAAAGSVVLAPTLLLGATFPLLVEVLSRARGEFHRSLGMLYRVNTLGGAAGVLLGGFVLMPLLGMRGSFLLAALANLVVGTTAFVSSRGEIPGATAGGPAAPAGARQPSRPRPVRLPAVFVLTAAATGACSLGLEILWTRSLALVIGSSIYSFNLMLLAFLLGIVLGTAVYERIEPRLVRPQIVLAAALGGAGILIGLDMALVGWLPLLFFNLMKIIPATFLAHQATGFALCLLAMLPITTAFGFTFPLLVHLVDPGGRTPQEISGLLYAWNTLGAILGALAISFVLVPATGLEASYVWMAALPLFAGLLVLGGALAWPPAGRAAAGAGLALLLLGIAAAWRPWDLRLMTAGVYKYGAGWVAGAQPGFLWLRNGLRQTRDLLFYEEGQEAVVSVVRSGRDNSILVNGKADGGTSRWDSATQKLLAHVPLALHPGARRALVIGWGTGGTAGTAALYPLADLQVVEIEPAVFRAAPLFAEVNRGVERDPRFRILFNDARTVLLTSAARYDVIISEPSNPWISGVSNLFTRDFYRIALPRLEPDGVFCQWFHYYNMTLDDIRMQIRTFTDVFPRASLWVVPPSPPEEGPSTLNGDLLLIGSRVAQPLDVRRVGALFADPGIAASLAAVAVRDARGLLLDRVMDEEDMRVFAGEGPRNTDDDPAIEFSAPKGLFIPTEQNAVIYDRLEAAGRAVVPPLVGDPDLRADLRPRERAAAYLRLAALLQRKAMLERAGRLLRVALDLDAESAPALSALGEILYLQGRPEEAETLLRRALDRDAGLSKPYAILGFLYLSRRDLPAARRAFDDLVRRFPAEADGYYGQAVLEADAGDWALARTRLEKALGLRPGMDQARQLLDYVNRQGR